jgi:hypothetical protein
MSASNSADLALQRRVWWPFLLATALLLVACDGAVVQPPAPLPAPPVNEVPRPSLPTPGAPVRLLAVDPGLTLIAAGGRPMFGVLARVVDANDIGVSGVNVAFRVVEGDGVLTDSLIVTDRGGYARAETWQLGQRLGRQRLRAFVPDLGEVFLDMEAVEVPALLTNAAYALVAIERDSLPVNVSRDYDQVRVVGASIHLSAGTYRLSTRVIRAGDEIEERETGSYTQDGTNITFASKAVRGVVSADGRLQMVSYYGDWPFGSDVVARFARIP